MTILSGKIKEEINMFSKLHQGGRSNRWRFCVGTIATLSFIANAFADTAPTILIQPQSQTVNLGNTVVLSVSIANGSAAPSLPSVSSGTLNLWLRADAGVITNASGQVSEWQDQSGNTNHAFQGETDLQPSLVYPPGIEGRAAVRFNGSLNGSTGEYLFGAGDVGVPNAMTAFSVYNFFTDTNAANIAWLVGVPGTVYGASRCLATLEQELDFGTWTYDYQVPRPFPTNTYRVCTDRVNTNLTTVEIFDYSATTATNFSAAMSLAVAPSPGYYVGGLNPALQFVTADSFNGDLSEVIIYRGYLSDADRLAVQNYLQQKYYFVGSTNGLGFQWTFDGTNIAGATSANLTLTDVNTNEAGIYAVVVTDTSGSTTSSNAVLSVNSSSSACAPAPEGLISWWPAEGNANDIDGGNNGILENGASFGLGEVGQAFTFNGNFQYVQIADSPSLHPASMTVECWFNLSNAVQNGGYMNLMSKPVGSLYYDSFAFWLEAGTINGAVGSSSLEGSYLIYPFTPVPGVWHHAAFTFDSGTETQSIYLDGVPVASGQTGVQIGYDTHPALIGCDSDYGTIDQPFDGRIDEVSIYSRALTSNEINAQFYNRRKAPGNAMHIISNHPWCNHAKPERRGG